MPHPLLITTSATLSINTTPIITIAMPTNSSNMSFRYLQLGLDPPIRQGQTRYPFFIVQMQKDETCELTLAMSE